MSAGKSNNYAHLRQEGGELPVDYLRHRVAELEAAVNSMADGLVIYDLDTHIVHTNAAADEIIGYSELERQSTLGDRGSRFLHPIRPDGSELAIEDTPVSVALRGEVSQRVAMGIHTPSGRLVWTSVSAAPLRGPDGDIEGAVATFTDVTDIIEGQKERERLVARLREAVRARDDFLSAAAHELKTPVTSLRGYSQVLLRRLEAKGSLDPATVRKAMSQIDHQAERLSRLVNQLLDLSRIDAGRLFLDRQDAEVGAVVRRTLATFRRLHPRREFVFECGQHLVASIDPLRLEQVLVNLLDNAVKFSPPDTPVVVTLQLRDESVEIGVRDHGVGIPPERREHVFERFYQAHEGEWHGGVGLGLFVSRQIAELHGGSIELESPGDGGTRFLVSIPYGMAMRAAHS